MSTIRENDGKTEYQCPVCKTRYTWDGNFSGLMLVEAEGQPFVCNDCQAEGERLNDEAVQRINEKHAPIWEAARTQWPEMVERPSIHTMLDSEPAYEVEVRHLDTGQVEYEYLEPVQVGPYRMAYSFLAHSLAVWGYWQALQPQAETEQEMMGRALRDAGYTPVPNEPPEYERPDWLQQALTEHGKT